MICTKLSTSALPLSITSRLEMHRSKIAQILMPCSSILHKNTNHSKQVAPIPTTSSSPTVVMMLARSTANLMTLAGCTVAAPLFAFPGLGSGLDESPVPGLGPPVGDAEPGPLDGRVRGPNEAVSPRVGRAALGSTAQPPAVDAGQGRGVTWVAEYSAFAMPTGVAAAQAFLRFSKSGTTGFGSPDRRKLWSLVW